MCFFFLHHNEWPPKHINKFLPPTQSRDNPQVCLCLCVFFPKWPHHYSDPVSIHCRTTLFHITFSRIWRDVAGESRYTASKGPVAPTFSRGDKRALFKRALRSLPDFLALTTSCPPSMPSFLPVLSIASTLSELRRAIASPKKGQAMQRCHEEQSLGPPPPRVAAVKEHYLVQCGKCRGFFVKFLADIFPGNRRTKIRKIFRQIFTSLFAHLLHKFHQNFALGENWPNKVHVRNVHVCHPLIFSSWKVLRYRGVSQPQSRYNEPLRSCSFPEKLTSDRLASTWRL